MNIRKESLSIVIVGNWNSFILSPEWTAKNLFDEPKIIVDMPLNAGFPPYHSSKISHIRLIPQNERVTFIALKIDKETISKMNNMAYKLLNFLNYTPISSFGFNFGYFENIGKINLSELFGLQGDSSFKDLGYQTKYKAVKRGLMVEGKLLNLNITHIGKKVNFDFNFHYDVTNCLLAKKIISDQIIENKNIAEKILRKVYKLKLDKTKGEEYGNNNLYPKLT